MRDGGARSGDALDGSAKKECAYSVSAPAEQYSFAVEAVTAGNVTVNRSAVVKLSGSGQTKVDETETQ